MATYNDLYRALGEGEDNGGALYDDAPTLQERYDLYRRDADTVITAIHTHNPNADALRTLRNDSWAAFRQQYWAEYDERDWPASFQF